MARQLASGVTEAQFSFSPVETIFLSQKTPLSGAFLVNIPIQTHIHSSLPSTTPSTGVSVGEIAHSQSFVENGYFPTISLKMHNTIILFLSIIFLFVALLIVVSALSKPPKSSHSSLFPTHSFVQWFLCS